MQGGAISRGSLFLLILLFGSSVQSVEAQGDSARADADSSDFIFRPTVGLGTGMLTFYGDVGKNHRFYHPTVSRVGYELKVSNPLTPYLDFGFHVMRGKLAANERFPERNLNFESRITTGGFNLSYNFDHFLPEDRKIEPFLSVGFEGFEFLSKTDLYDENGNRYHYWSDGTIRDRPEDAADAEEAKLLTRDYTYETDLRELNLDGFGDYPQRSWAVPLTIGANMKLSERVDMRFSSSMYFTFTDYIDNVTHKSKGQRQGDPMNDKYLYSSVSIHYDLQVTPFETEEEPEEEGIPLREFRFDNEDEDKDGVVDFLDECPRTPTRAKVDSNGCPLDKDEDAVADYTDEQLNTPDSLLRRVDTSGSPLTDSTLKQRFLVYMDSTGKYTEVRDTVYSRSVSDNVPRPKRFKPDMDRYQKRYMVKVGESTKGISNEERERLLSISDVRTVEKGDTAVYVVGDFENLPEAVRRKFELEAEGIEGEVVSKQKGQLRMEKVTYTKPSKEEGEASGPEEEEEKKGDLVYRVQLGAFSQELSRDIFKDVPNLLVLHSDDGLVRYVTGSFDRIKKAAEHKTEMFLKGYEDAFITAYRGGKKVPLDETEAEVTGEFDPDDLKRGSVNKDLIGFSVQIGAYETEIPTKELKRFMDLGEVKTVHERNVTKYLYGDFDSKKEAEKALEKAKERGIENAFVVGTFKRSIISASEAEKLLNKGE